MSMRMSLQYWGLLTFLFMCQKRYCDVTNQYVEQESAAIV